MILSRCFVKVYQTARKPLSHQPFARALQEIDALAEAFEETIVQDVRYALKGDVVTSRQVPLAGSMPSRKETPEIGWRSPRAAR